MKSCLRRPGLAFLACAAILSVAVPPKASAFEIQGGATDSRVPKFDIEEQAGQFRKGDTGKPLGNLREIDTPWGKGTMYFGVDQSPRSGFSPMFSPSFGSGFGSNFSPQDTNRLLAPPGLQHRYNDR